MPDYDLTGLSTRSFEQMIQALSYKILGPGLVIFGDGPDGGREATFSGHLSNFPSTTDCWDGYVVVQAKFCQRPKGKPREDAQWALKELTKEIEAFTAKRSKRTKPEYYIFVTNVVLTPVQRNGGKDKATDLIRKYSKALGLKDSRVWDYDQLCRYIDADQDVRNAYRTWITPGDVLAKLASTLEKSNPDFTKTMLNFLQKELLDDHYSKLEQAGHAPENRVPLENVFVDLPTFPERLSEAPKEGEDQKPLPAGFLDVILKKGMMCLKSDEAFSQKASRRQGQVLQQTEPGRYVMIGGPGQGKSTLSQFLCQIHRANLLKTRRGLDKDAKDAVKSIIIQCKRQGLDASSARRFPFRIELARFAKVLATQKETSVSSILSYIAFVIKERTDSQVTSEDLRIWLHDYPWLLILDGLDEVPASSNRSQVLDAIRDFQVDIATCEADVFLFATTRPQGYNEEFSSKRYEHTWLAPLSIARALHYGTTLIELTYQHDIQRKKEVLSRLQDAAKVDATMRLMESPLQVTIMARLLAQIAKPPQERYKLFQQYYKVIYRREIERNVPVLSQLLRDYETDIDAIHYHSGLLLQIESEKTQHTDATLSINEFKAVVSDRLNKEGHSEGVLDKLTESIVKCATDRLVFLVPSQSERVGFEIRSLQEFMAAEALMDGRDAVVIERIKAIAAVPYWQNILLFAAGKCFSERQWLRDSISNICGEMNDNPNDQLAHFVQAGSRVALALLEDGPARRQPAYSQALARRALALLLLPASQIHDDLADVYENEFEIVYREEIERFFAGQYINEQLGAWRVLLRLSIRKKIAWAQEYIKSHWPTDKEEEIKVFSLTDISEDPWMCKKFEERFFALPNLKYLYKIIPSDYDEIIKRRIFVNEHVISALKLETFWWHRRNEDAIILKLPEVVEIQFGCKSIDKTRQLLSPFSSLVNVNHYWDPLIQAAQFVTNPTKEGLSHILVEIAKCFPFTDERWPHYFYALPWPLIACLKAAETPEELILFAEQITKGKMGDYNEWKAAEKRWREKGLSVDDIRYMEDENWPIPQDIANIGFPLLLNPFIMHWKEYEPTGLIEFWKMLPGSKSRTAFAPWFFHVLTHRLLRESSRLLPTLGFDVISAHKKDLQVSYDAVTIVFQSIKKLGTAIPLLGLLGNKLKGIYGGIEQNSSLEEMVELDDFLVKAVNADSSLVGVCLLLSTIAEFRKITQTLPSSDFLIENKDPSIARAGIILSLCKPKLDGDDLRQITDTLVEKWSSDHDNLQRFLSVIHHNLMQNDIASYVLEHLLEKIPNEMIEERGYSIELMVNLLGQRVTRLQEDHIWKGMELPQGLHGILSR
jgi:hypothetical protein